MTVANSMFTFSDLLALHNNDGATLRNGRSISYKSGYQAATDGVAYDNALTAFGAICRYGGNCGIWLENGIYYIDNSHRVSTKRQAIVEGTHYNQISVLKWADMSLIYIPKVEA